MKTMPIVFKQIVSEFVDVILCMIPALLIYFFSRIDTRPLNFVHITALIYLLYTWLSTFLSNGQSIGDIIQKIILINTKKGERSKSFFLIRSVIKSAVIFLIAGFDQTNLVYLIIIVLLFFPIKIVTKDFTYYSFLSLGFRTTYINTKDS